MKQNGVLLSFLAAIISGVAIFSNSIFVAKTDPLVFALVRNAVVLLCLTSILVATKKFSSLRLLTKSQWGKLVLIGAIGGGIPFALFFTGLSQIGAVNGNILNKTLFLWVALLAVPILKEKISWFQLVGYGALFVGLFFFGGTFAFVPKTGSFLVLAATILWAIEHVIAKVTLRDLDASIVSWGRIAFGLPFLFGAMVAVGKTPVLIQPATYATGPILASSILLSGYMLAWYSAIKRAPVSLVSSVLVCAPVITLLLSTTILHKSVAQTQVIQMVLLTVGAIIISLPFFRPKEEVLPV